MTSSVLVTGGCGFIGTNLVLRLLDRDESVRVADDFSAAGAETLRQSCRSRGLDPPPVHELDVTDPTALDEVVEGVEAIVHLAAFTDVRESTQHPEREMETNVRGTFNVLTAARRSSTVERFVFASSNAAVGEVDGSVDETRVPRPLSPYGASKLYGEALASAFAGSYGLRTVSLRFANAYGPYSDHKTSVVHKFVRRALDGRPLEIYGDGEQTRDFIHARDVARAVETVLRNPPEQPELYQVATGREVSINELARRIRTRAQETGRTVEVVHTDPQPGEIRHNFSCVEKIHRDFGWEPEVDLRQGLENVWTYYAGPT